MAIRKVEHIMGAPISVDLRDGDAKLADQAFDWLREADARFNPANEQSEVARLDRGELTEAQVSADLRHVLTVCERYERRSGGAFRARLPGRRLDPCAVVKGWAVQRASMLLRNAGARRFCINAGGDVVAAGAPRPGQAWRVGIRHPDQPGQLGVVLAVRDSAVATSAADERGDHIVDGRTGLPAQGLLSVTVAAPDLTIADATATAAYALGADGPKWADAQPGCAVYAVDTEYRVFRSPELAVVR